MYFVCGGSWAGVLSEAAGVGDITMWGGRWGIMVDNEKR